MSLARQSGALLSLISACLFALSSGCGFLRNVSPTSGDTKQSFHDSHGLSIEYPQVQEVQSQPASEAKVASEPMVLQDPSKLPALEMTLQEAVQLAVQQSPVLRTIGGTIVSGTQGTSTIYDPALAAANPQGGTEAALSAFDAQFNQQLFWTKTDRPNNILRGGVFANFTPSVSQATGASYIGDLSKQTANGAQFALRHVVNYNRSNQPSRFFRSDFVGWLEAEWRQPLMRGSGTKFNRIAGPNSGIGQYNGVLIARVNEDVALADFENAVIGLVADVEQSYWDLANAYRILEATLKGRVSALQTFQYQQVRLEVGTGRTDEEAQAQSQYYQFQSQVESALGGEAGLYALEQRLRYLVGLTATDGRLIKPTTQPTDIRVVFDWESALGQALERRVEIRKQKLSIKRREMELYAARCNRRPQLDFLGQYRWRGLGDHLIGPTDAGLSDNLYQSITDGDYQEWQAGFEMNFPVGLRAASVAVSHARLNLTRERALMAETELRISHDLSNAARQIHLTHQLLETNYNRYLADLRQVEVLERRYRDGSDNINFLLQAQRQVVTSETEFYRALTNYNVAIRDFHREKGSLLAYNQVQLEEGAWSQGAKQDAYHVGKFLAPNSNPGNVTRPAPISRGGFNPSAVQDSAGAESVVGADASQVMGVTSSPAIEGSPTEYVPGEYLPAESFPGDTPLPAAEPTIMDSDVLPTAPRDPMNLDARRTIKVPARPVSSRRGALSGMRLSTE